VAVFVAALGIVNTLTMNVVERVREIGVLRATGMTRRQVGRMVVVEAGILGLIGAVLGIATGLAAGAVMVTLAGGDLELPSQLALPAVATCLVLGVAVSMLAAYYPARLAGRLSIVRAVQFE
jgi:putative ABC transport system permease protein